MDKYKFGSDVIVLGITDSRPTGSFWVDKIEFLRRFKSINYISDMANKKEMKAAYTVEVLNKTGKAEAFLWIKGRESAGAVGNWTILNKMLQPSGRKIHGPGSSTKLADVITTLKLSQKKMANMGIDQVIPERPYNLKEVKY